MSAPSQLLSVLVIEENDLIREVLTALLDGQGHRVTAVSRPREALEIFQTAKFHLVITDSVLPAMTGDDLAVSIRAIAPAQPIIMLTPTAPRLSCHPNARVNCLLPRPFTPEEFHTALNEVAEPESPPSFPA